MKVQKNQSFHFGLSSFVLEAGLEPARTNVHWILSPTRIGLIWRYVVL